MNVKFRILPYFSFLVIIIMVISLAIFGIYGEIIVSVAILFIPYFLISCPHCGKSPFYIRNGLIAVGSFIPEKKCSRCSFDYFAKL